jgi:hypothetical protein
LCRSMQPLSTIRWRFLSSPVREAAAETGRTAALVRYYLLA